MSDQNKNRPDNFTVGPIRVQKYFNGREGEIMKLEILIPKRIRARGCLKDLFLEDYRTAILSIDDNDDKNLRITLTNITLESYEEVPE
ncbi:MAG: hypothetical protein V1896_02635 [Candidatus Zambryskibacteria bacterium]